MNKSKRRRSCVSSTENDTNNIFDASGNLGLLASVSQQTIEGFQVEQFVIYNASAPQNSANFNGHGLLTHLQHHSTSNTSIRPALSKQASNGKKKRKSRTKNTKAPNALKKKKTNTSWQRYQGKWVEISKQRANGRCLGCKKNGPVGMQCFTGCKKKYSKITKKKIHVPITAALRRKLLKAKAEKAQTQRNTEYKKRVGAAEQPFNAWMDAHCDFNKKYAMERVRIQHAFSSYSEYCSKNKHGVLLALRSKISGLKFTEELLKAIFKRSKGPTGYSSIRKKDIKLMRDVTDTLCIPFLKLRKRKK